MFWKPRNKGITISAELHEKIARNALSIYQADSEVVQVRPLENYRMEKKGDEPGYKPFLCYGTH